MPKTPHDKISVSTDGTQAENTETNETLKSSKVQAARVRVESKTGEGEERLDKKQGD